jgi:hypothetical protein
MKDSDLLLITGLLTAAPLFAMGQSVTEHSDLKLEGGLDMRIRYEYKDNWMNSGKSSVSSKYEDYLRLRTRLYGAVSYGDNYLFFLRLANEFRDYHNSTKNKKKNAFPDEVYLDNIYFDLKNIKDRVNLRIGRQDIELGSGRVVSDGTPGDGSRSTYFNAVRATVRMMEKSDVELIATYNHYRDDLTLGNPYNEHDLTRIKSGSPYSEMKEIGLITYLHYNEIDKLPIEFYYIWKRETSFYDKTNRYPGRDTHTLGTRIEAEFSERLSGEVEAAVQGGRIDGAQGMHSRDILAWMGYAGLTYKDEEVFGRPKLTGALLYLSGDSDSYYKTTNGATDNGWNPVFNRSSWFSEVCSSFYDKYRWSNLIYPHIAAQIEPSSKHRIKFQTGPMFAAAKDNDAEGSYRGYFTQLRYEFPVLSKIFRERGSAKGAIVGEMLYFGDYYEHHTADVDEDAAYWLRFELKVAI